MADITERTIQVLYTKRIVVALSGGDFGGELALIEDFTDGAEKNELHITRGSKQSRYRYDAKSDKTHAVFVDERDV